MADSSGLDTFVFKGDVAGVQKLVDQDPALANLRNEHGDTALHSACGAKQLDILILLLARGSNPNAKGCYGRTPLHYAVWEGNARSVPLVRALIESGADPSISENNGLTPGDLARMEMDEGLADVLKLLENCLAQKSSGPDLSNWPKIHQLVWEGDVSAVGRLLHSDPKIANLRNADGDTPLHVACWAKQMGMLHLFVIAETDLNMKGFCGRTPLHYAVHEGRMPISLNIIMYLAQYGANPAIKDDNGFTPAEWAKLQMKEGLPMVLEELAKGPFPQLDTKNIEKTVAGLRKFGESTVRFYLSSLEVTKEKARKMGS